MKLKRNIGLIGKMHDGKSTVAGILAKEYGYGVWHFAEPVKELGDKALVQIIDPYLRDASGKTMIPTKAMNRVMYQFVGARGRAYDAGIWVKQLGVRYRREGSPRGIVIDDMRYKNEAAWCKVGEFVLIRIRRPEEERMASIKDAFRSDYRRKITESELTMIQNHESETEVDSIEFDHLIENDDDVDVLRDKVKEVMEGL